MYKKFECNIENFVFEWDESKDALNFQKHGIHFKTAVKVFLDPYMMIREDEEHPEELRFNILGKVRKVLFVVCTFRNQNTVRIVSARLASTLEKERYAYGEDDF